MVMGLEDLGQLLPPRITLHTADKHAFAASELWKEVGKRLASGPGKALYDAMAPEAQSYVNSLINGSCVHLK